MMLAELRLALRGFLTHWPLYGALLLILGVGLAATLTLFCVADALRFRPLRGIPTPDLVHIGIQDQDGTPRVLTFSDLDRLRQQVPTLESITGIMTSGCLLFDRDRQIRTTCAEVTPGFWTLVSMAPGTAAQDFQPSADARAAVVSDRFWREQFRGQALHGVALIKKEIDPTTMRPVERPVRVIGIAPATFQQPGHVEVDVWMTPLPARGSAITFTTFQVWAQLRRSATHAAAAAQVARALQREPSTADSVRVIVRPLADALVPDGSEAVTILLLTSLGLLLIGWIAAGTLLAARAVGARHEDAVRAALGASTWDLVRRHLVQTTLLALAGLAAALLLTVWWLPLMVRTLPFADGRHVAVGPLGLGLATALAACGAGVMWLIVCHVTRDGRQHTGTAAGLSVRSRPPRVSAGLRLSLATALALTTAFGYVAMLLALDFGRVYGTSPGFDPTRLATLTALLPFDEHRDSAATRTFYTTALMRIRALPTVESATLINHSGPLGGWRSLVELRTEDRDRPPVLAQDYDVEPRFFRVLRIPLRRGREFLSTDWDTPAVIINEHLARVLGRGRDLLHERVWVRDAPHTVIGIVGDLHERDLRVPPAPQVYFLEAGETFLIRSQDSLQAQTIADVSAVLRALHAQTKVLNVRRYADVVWSMTALERSRAVFMGLLAAAAWLTGLLALGGHVSHLVRTQRRPTAILRALGAHHARVLAYAFVPLLFVVAGAMTVGLGVGVGAGHLLGATLVGPIGWEPVAAILSLTCVLLGFMLVSLAPIRRLLHMTPVDALKGD